MTVNGVLEFRGRLRSAANTSDNGLAVQLGLGDGTVSLTAHDLVLGQWSTSSVDVHHQAGRVFTLVIEDEPWFFVPESPSYFKEIGLELFEVDPDADVLSQFLEYPVPMAMAIFNVIVAVVVGAGVAALFIRPGIDVWVTFAAGLVGGALGIWWWRSSGGWFQSILQEVRESSQGVDAETTGRGRGLVRKSRLFVRTVFNRITTTLRTGRVGGDREDVAVRSAPQVGEGVADGLSYQWRSSVEGLDVLTRFLPPEDVRKQVERLNSAPADPADQPEQVVEGEDELIVEEETHFASGDQGPTERSVESRTDEEPTRSPRPKVVPAPASKANVDDLTAIKGIGPATLKVLNELGYRTYLDLAVIGQEDIDQISEALGPMAGRMERDDWIGQAAQLFFEKRRESSLQNVSFD